MNQLEKKWKSLLHKVGYLKFELDDRKEKFSKFESEIGDRLVKIDPEINAPKPPQNIESDNQNEEGDTHNDSNKNDEVSINDKKNDTEPFKKLWKQIALKTHPDKNGDDQELTNAYKRALEAWNDGEIEILVDIAIELEIKIVDPTQEMINCLEKRASFMESEIKKYESNVLWAWGHADEEKQSLIVDELLRYKRNKRKI